jgi:hypothetical protein
MPTFSRHSATDTDDERPTQAAGNATPVRARADVPPARHDMNDTTITDGQAVRDDRDAANRDANVAVANRRAAERAADRPEADRTAAERGDRTVAGPKPRASMLATFGLILGVVSALLVLSGPLLGYGIGLAVLALILSLSGISATSKRHVAGRTDALIGMILSLGAIVVGVLALTGSLSWLGTDMQPVNSLREWLDTQSVNRF